jgi:hypothetical protein
MRQPLRSVWGRLAALSALALAALAAAWAPPGEAAAQKKKKAKSGAQAGGPIVIVLKKEFIEKYKDRVTIAADFNVDTVGPIHPPKQDGDMHFSGRAEEVGLPIVAEIQNAKSQMAAVNAVRKAAGKDPIRLTGVWRLWCEHAGGGVFEQGAPLEKFPDSNPDHVFEIHPVTRVGKLSVLGALKPIKGYTPKDAHRAFLHYENVKCKITPKGGTIAIRTGMAGYNHVKFMLETLQGPEKHRVIKGDGRFVMCAVRDTDGDLVARRVRLAFVEGSAPELAVRELAKGERLMVLGLPRIDLALVSWRVEHQDDPREPLTWNLPYEMTVIGVYDE